MGITYVNVRPRQTLANAIETFSVNNSLPGMGVIESLTFKVDYLQNGATDSSDLAGINKLDTITVFGGTIKSEVTHSDQMRIQEKVWDSKPLFEIGEDDNEGLAVRTNHYLNPDVQGDRINFNAPYGAPQPGAISQVNILTAADQTAMDTAFLTVWAVVNTDKTSSQGWVQYKRKVRTAVAGAFEDDPITDLNRYLAYAAFMTTGIKDAAGAVPAGLGIRGVQLQTTKGAIMDQVTSDAILVGGSQYNLGSATASNVTVANYDFAVLDFGIRSGGRPLSGSSFVRVEEGVAEATRRYHIGLGT